MNQPSLQFPTNEPSVDPLQVYRVQAWQMLVSLEMDLGRINALILNRQIPIIDGIKQVEQLVSDAIESMNPKQEALDPLVGKTLRMLDEIANSYQILWQMLGKAPAGTEAEEYGIDKGSDKGFDEV